MTTTGRQDVVSGLLSVLATYKTANPTLLRRVLPARPESFGELPAAYVGLRDETIIHTSGTRQRTFTPTVVLVDRFSDNLTVSAAVDVLVDGLVEAYTAAPHAINGAILRMTAVSDAEVELPGTGDGVTTWYRGVIFTFADITLMEGRN